MSYTETNWGTADRRSYMEIPKSQLPLAEEPTTGDSATDYPDFDSRRFANLVYIVGGGGASGGGTISVTSDTKQYAQVIVDNNTGTIWIAEANPGTAQASALWRVKRIVRTSGGGSDTTVVSWADGNSNFDNVGTAAGLSGLTYS